MLSRIFLVVLTVQLASAAAELTLTIRDLPPLNPPNDNFNRYIEYGEPLPAPYVVDAATDCPGNRNTKVIVSSTDETVPGNCACSYIIKRTYSAVDECANAARLETFIHVSDTIKPQWNVELPGDITMECGFVPVANLFSVPTTDSTAANTNATNTPTEQLATDSCRPAAAAAAGGAEAAPVTIDFRQTRVAGRCPNEYTLTRTWIARDSCGNENSHTQTITVVDRTPVFIDPASLPAVGRYACAADIPKLNQSEPLRALPPTKGESCDQSFSVSVRESRATAECGVRFQVQRTFTFTDCSKNTDSISQIISVGPPPSSDPNSNEQECSASGVVAIANGQGSGVKSLDSCTPCLSDTDCFFPLTCDSVTKKCASTNYSLGVGAACCANSECASPSVCGAGGHCECTQPDNGCPAGEFCTPPNDASTCGFGIDANCRPKLKECESCCTENSHCAEFNQICSTKNSCVTPNTLSTNEECCADEQCLSNICCENKCVEPHSKDMGESCCHNSECKTDRCKQGVCVCKSDSDCPPGKFCRKHIFSANQCVDKKPECASCQRDGWCQTGRCVFFRCITGNENYPMGHLCCRDQQCATGSCSTGPGGLCQCKTDAHCPAGQYCAKGFLGIGKNKCLPKKAECAGCTSDHQCISNKCRFFKCITGTENYPMGHTCCRNEQCASGDCNADGKCQCHSNSHCPPGQYCAIGFLGLGKNQCKPLKSECADCGRDEECAGGKCRWFKCITGTENYPIGHNCCRDPQCASGDCNSDGKCQCSSDGQCPSGQYCDHGFLGIGKNSCRPKKSCGLTKLCNRDAMCQSNDCGGLPPHCRNC